MSDDLIDDIFIVLVWNYAVRAVLPSVVQYYILPTAVIILNQRAVTEQAIERFRVRSGVAWKPLALLVAEKFIAHIDSNSLALAPSTIFAASARSFVYKFFSAFRAGIDRGSALHALPPFPN